MSGLYWSAASAVARLSVGFLIFAILAHRVSTEEFGIVAYYYTFSVVLSLFLDYGFNLRLSRDAVSGGEVRNAAVAQAVTVKCIHSILAFLMFICWQWDGDHLLLGAAFFLGAFLNVVGSTLFPLLRGDNEFRSEAKVVLSNNLIAFFVFALLVSIDATAIYAFPVALIVGKSFLVQRFLSFGIKNNYRMPKSSDYKDGALSSFTFFVHAASAYLFWNIDTLLLKEFVGFDEVGRYQAAIRMLVGVTVATDVISNFCIPHMMRNGFSTNGRPIPRYHWTLLGILIASSVLLTLAGWVVFRFGMVPVFGPNYALEPSIVLIFTSIVFLRYYGVFFGILLTILHAQAYRMYTGLAGTAVMLILFFQLTPENGMQGAAAANLGAHIVVNFIYSIAGWFLIRRRLSDVPV